MMASLMLEAAVRSFVLALCVWLGMKAMRLQGAAARRAVWLMVLCGALAMPLLCYWSPLRFETRVQMPVLANSPVVTAKLATIRNVVGAPLAQRVSQPARSPDFRAYAEITYFTVAALFFLRVLVGLALAFRLKRNSAAAPTGDYGSHPVRISGQIKTPVTVGSTIILPASSTQWDAQKLAIVLAHEAWHVRGGDFYWQLAARIHACLFWFSPLPWWLERELSDASEAASDEAGRSQAATSSSYAELLVEFAQQSGRFAPGVPMARRSNLPRRIERILADRQPLAAKTIRRQIAVAACLIPVVVLGASASLRAGAAEPMPLLQNPPAPVSPAAPPAPVPPPAPPTPLSLISSYHHTTGNNAYVIVSGDSVTMSGSSEDLSQARHLKGSEKGDYIWFVRGGKSYIIDDPELVRQSKELFRPQEELGRRQALLGEQQAKLGEEQARLGELQSKVAIKAPEMEKELAELLAKVKQIEAASRKIDQEQLSKLQEQLANVQAKLGDAQALAGEEQGKLGEKQGKLGELQGELGEKQGKLGEEQGRLGEEAARKMQRLFDDALRSGKARQVH
jgi:beta-lactamase regulating signal transducer with metallopeptidase domain